MPRAHPPIAAAVSRFQHPLLLSRSARLVCILVAALCLFLVLHTPPVRADDPHLARCMAHQDLAAHLQKAYGEESMAHGLSIDGTLLEIFAGPEGSYTAVKLAPKGQACIVDFGVGWEMQSDESKGTALHREPARPALIPISQ